jgi:dipeptide/tripeptide permease
MNSRRLLLFVALPVILLLERVSYHWMRALLPLYMKSPAPGGFEMSSAEFRPAIALLGGLTVFSPLFGGLLAIATGPRIPLVIGTLIASVGCVILANGDAAVVPLALALYALGAGLFKPNIYAIAGAEFGAKEENARNALFFALAGTAGLGAVLAPIGSALTQTPLGTRGTFHINAAGFLLTAILCGGLVAALVAMRNKSPPAAPEGPVKQARGHRGAFVLLLLLAPYLVGHPLASSEAVTALVGLDSGPTTLLYGSEVIAGMLVTVAGFATLLALSLSSSKAVPTLLVIGAGLSLFVLGAAVLISLRGAGASLPVIITALGLLGAGGALIDSLSLSRISADGSPRFSTLLIAVWMMVTNGLSTLLSAAQRAPTGPGLPLAAGAAFVSSVLLFVLAKRINRAFFSSEPQEGGQGA